jgi:hypothetical protein
LKAQILKNSDYEKSYYFYLRLMNPDEVSFADLHKTDEMIGEVFGSVLSEVVRKEEE